MKIVILAAGIGSRLDNREGHLPKALTKLVNNYSILAWQLKNLASYGLLKKVSIVVGYRQELIRQAFPALHYIFNPFFQSVNTAKSLLCALEKIDEDLLWLNGDIVFHPSIVEKIIHSSFSSVVANQIAVKGEEVKYSTDQNGDLLEISKQVAKPQGEAVGINFYKQADLKLLRKALEDCASYDYFEKAMERCIQQGQKIKPCIIAATDCIEIDFPLDLIHANQLILKWNL